MIGTTLAGRYEILRQLGQGGMGAVYEARHTGTGRRVAVKLVSADIGKDPSLLRRFELEARAAGGLESQHVAQVLDVGRDDATSVPFMVMEYLAGEDVQQLVKRLGPVRIDLALRIAAQTCLGLAKAHEAHIIHRDIKSANLFLARRDGGERVVKILDFGIAKVKMDEMQKTEGGITQTGAILGSPVYMSPEQARGKKTIDRRTDLWSLGVVLYQMLSGKPPHAGVESLGELIIQICSEPAPPLSSVAPWVAPEIERVVHKALELSPDSRYQTADEMFRDLKALIGPSVAIEEELIAALPEAERAHVAQAQAGGRSPDAAAHALTGHGTTGPSNTGPSAASHGPASPSDPAAKGPSTTGPDIARTRMEGRGGAAPAAPAVTPLVGAQPVLHPSPDLAGSAPSQPDLRVSTGGTSSTGPHSGVASAPKGPRWPLFVGIGGVAVAALSLGLWLTRGEPSAPSGATTSVTTARPDAPSPPLAATPTTPTITPAASPEVPAPPASDSPAASASGSARPAPSIKATVKPAASAAKSAAPTATATAATPPPSATVSGRIIRTTLP